MEAQIFSIGTEILLGTITDTNSKFIAEKLADLGINLYKMETIGDNYKRLYEAMKEVDGKVDYVFTTGGLGPTADDISKEVAIDVCQLNNEIEIDQVSYQEILKFFNNNEYKARENIKQAKFPKSAIILKNKIGTAPGCIIKSKSKTKYILLPGPPKEMVPMFENELMKYLHKEAFLKSVFVKTGLLEEWDMASRIDLNKSNPTISPYISDQGPLLRISAMGKNQEDVDKKIIEGLDLVEKKLYPYVITSKNIRKEELLINLLRERNELVSTAESITGGLIASSIIDIPGASDVLKESYITYANESKEKILNVSCETIKEYTVVSKEVVREMALGLNKITNSNLCIATTGYAHKGEVYVGVFYNGKVYVRYFKLSGDRNLIRQRIKNYALDMVILIMRGVYESNIGI